MNQVRRLHLRLMHQRKTDLVVQSQVNELAALCTYGSHLHFTCVKLQGACELQCMED